MANVSIKNYEDSNGNKKYFFRIRLGDKVTTRRGFYSKQEAEIAYFNLKQDYFNKKLPTEIRKVRFSDLYLEWLEHYKISVRPTSFKKTEQLFELHIIPYFGDKYIDNITISDCQKAINSWGSTLSRYKSVYNYANKIFKYAIKYDYLVINPLEKADLPKNTQYREKVIQKKNKNNFYSKKELQKFLEYAKMYDYKAFVLFRIFAYTGMRRGEVLALEWNAINFETGYLTVSKNLVFVRDFGKQIAPTKNGKSREIVLDNETLDILRKWKKISTNKKIVFPNSKGNYMSLSKPIKWQATINKAIKLNHHVTLHGFRHTHAVLLYDMNPNITPKDVQKRLGHSNVNVTMNIYEHATENSDKKILNALDKI